jgi:hypothetical protein
MKGRRVYPDSEGRLLLAEGDYGQDTRGAWYVRCPGNSMGRIDETHEIAEHPDGTITVSPSIGISAGPGRPWAYHGFLERGVWRSV